MKKPFLFALLLISINTFAFSLTENVISSGFGYNFTYEKFSYNNEKHRYNNYTPEIIINWFFTNNDFPVGFFINGTIGFPKTDIINNNINKKNDAISMDIGVVLKTDFRYRLNEKFCINFGIDLILDFFRCIFFDSILSNERKTNNFTYFGIKPYISFGIYL